MVAYMEHKDLANEVISRERAGQIRDGVHRVQEQIALAEAAAGRPKGSVQLLAATKTRDVAEIMAAIDAGIRFIGENRPQEVSAKAEGLERQCFERGLVWNPLDAEDGEGVTMHLIGQLQSNKISKIIDPVDTVESVDSLSLAQKLSRRMDARDQYVNVYLEVNESGEEAKSGCLPQEAEELAYQLAAMPGLKLRGLMTVGAHVDDERVIRAGFRAPSPVARCYSFVWRAWHGPVLRAVDGDDRRFGARHCGRLYACAGGHCDFW